MGKVWQGCYEKRHGKLITKESVSHPAKMAVALCERIFDYGFEMGYWQAGDTVIDPFAGIFTTGLVGAYRKLRVIGVELEKPFAELAQANIALNRQKLTLLGRPLPVVVQGDSRYLRRVLNQQMVTAAVSSPPYSDTDIASKTGSGSYGQNYAETGQSPRALYQMGHEKYGAAEGQLAAMKPGDLDSVTGAVSSPPFMGKLEDGGWQLLGKYAAEGKLTVAQANGDPKKTFPSWNPERDTSYGHTDGQLADLPAGDLAQVAGSVSSPPFGASLAREMGLASASQVTAIDSERVGQRSQGDYGASAGQVGGMPMDDIGMVTAAVTSPPFAGNSGGTGAASSGPINARYPGVFERSLGGMSNGAAYGESSGQINAMRQEPVDDVIGAVTSPPYGGNDKRDHTKDARDDSEHGRGTFRGSYGRTEGQAGDMVTGDQQALDGKTYWSACALIYRELLAVLKPGGVVALVVKPYVQGGKIVDLVGQTERLMQALGYEHIETILASLVKESSATTLDGEVVTKRIERKGFFRRLHEKKRPETRIDFEAVIWCRKPGE